MLTADLLRARVYKGIVKPTYLLGKNAAAQDYAEQLCALYQRADQCSRAQMNEALEDIIGDAPDFLLPRGLAKLLDDRCTWASRASYPPQELRAALYNAAFARTHPQEGAVKTQRKTREQVIDEVAKTLNITASAIEASMFADHRDDERLTDYRPLTPEQLLQRYDIALAQAVLLRAQNVRLTVQEATGQQLRQLITALKFHQLLFDIEKAPASSKKSTKKEGNWTLTIDGPLSILQRSTRYGLQLAMLVPTLIHLKRWQLEAKVQWPRHSELLDFELSSKTGLKPTSRLKGAWISEEQKLLTERLQEADTPWTLDPTPHLLPLGTKDLFAPELTLKHPDGRLVHIEIVGTWRKDWLRKRLGLLKKHGPPNTILCVSRNLAAEKEKLSAFEGEIIEYAQVISLSKVLERLGG